MFTGIVEETGTVRSVRVGQSSAVLDVTSALVAGGSAVGDSVLTDGVCLKCHASPEIKKSLE